MSTEKLHDVVDHFNTAFLITGMEVGPTGRPMAIAEHDDSGNLWFITGRETPKTGEIARDDKAMVTLQSQTAWATLHGSSELVDDANRLNQLWTKGMEAWFPDGPEDSDIVLVKFTPERGAYWDMRGMKGVEYAFDAVKALATGEPLKPDEDDSSHSRVPA